MANDQSNHEDRHRNGLLMPEEVLDTLERDEPSAPPESGLTTVRDPSSIGDLGTADRVGEEGDEIGGAAHSAPGDLMRSSAVMAVGTVVSRITGFGRTVVLASALGTQLLGDAYQTANSVPFAVYDLLLGGLLASVFVPFLVKRRKGDADGGNATEQRLFTAMLLALFVISLVAILAAEWLIRLYAGEFTGAQHDVAVYLARFLLAQIFFIGASGIASAMLNARNHFAAPMWAPILHNLVVIAAGGLFLWVAGPGNSPESITRSDLTILGVGTAAAQVVQMAVLVWTLWRAGFRWRPRLDLRGESAAGAGYAAYQYASLIYQLPYAIIAVSVITALLPRMSGHVADGRKDLVRRDFSLGFRLSSVLIVPISVAMVVFAVPFCVLLYARGSMSVEDAQSVGRILTAFAVMLVPFTLFQLQQRVFYALGDTRTPSLIAVPAELAHATLAVLLLFTAPPHLIVVLLPLAYGTYYIVGSVLAWRMLARRLNGLDGRRTLRTLLLLYAASVPSAIFGVAMVLAFGVLPGTYLPALLGILAGGLVGILLFVLIAPRLGVTEVTTFFGMVRTRLLRR